MTNFGASDNAIAGVFLGCSSSGPKSTTCDDIGGSFANRIFAVGPVSGVQKYGTAVDRGNLKNRTSFTGESGNSVFDLFGGNPNCDNNTWFDNFFGSANQSCIH